MSGLAALISAALAAMSVKASGLPSASTGTARNFVCERLGEQTMSFHCVCKTFTEQDGKWIGRLFPVLLDVAQSEKAQFFGGLIIGEVAAVFDDFAQLHVQTFNGVGCINHFSNFRRFPPPSQRKESPVPIAVATSV